VELERIAKISAGNYRLAVDTTDEDGAAVTVTAPALAIVDGAGAEVTYEGTPVAAAGTITADVPAAALSELDTYRLTWSGTSGADALEWTQYVEICGGYLCTVAALRASDSSIASETKYPADTVRAARTSAEERFERLAGVAFVPRGRRVSLIGDGTARVRVPDTAIRRIVSASIAGVTLTAAELAALTRREWGAIDRPAGYVWTADAALELAYEHGEDYPPGPVIEAVKLLAREYLVKKALGSRATVEATNVGTFRLSVAGKDGSTGIPDVDAAAAAFGRRRPVVA